MYTFDENIVSDLHKEVYGVRPSSLWFQCWNEATDEEKQSEWDDLLESLAQTMDRQAEEEIQALNAFELEIASALDVGARSREDAIRWIVQSLDLDNTDLMYGGSAICYRKGLPYKMAAIFDNAINQLNYEVA
jgi:hypothetical protein